MRYSVVIPVYGNEGTIRELVARLGGLGDGLDASLEVVFVVDGSPDGSHDLLRSVLPAAPFMAQLIAHSRNFGSFAAIRTGLEAARGDFLAVMAADLQESPELMADFFRALESGDHDVVVGRREGRDDPALSALMSKMFWGSYRRTINREIPAGGVDVFGCTREVAARLVRLGESHSSLVGLLFWVGYRRAEVPYVRARRTVGKSAWSLRKRVRYLSDSIYAFTDLPIAALTWVGVVGSVLTTVAGVVVFFSWSNGSIASVGYTPLMLVILFSTFLILTGLGIVGSYVWRTYENSKGRPQAITMDETRFDGHA